MKRVEITYRSQMNEVAKLSLRLEKAIKAYDKKLEKAKKYGVDTMTNEERLAWLQTVETRGGWIVNKADIDKNGAWFDLSLAEDNVADIKRRLENAEKRLLNTEDEVEEYRNQISQIQDLKQKEELFRLEFEQEQNEWLKDGIKLERRYAGHTPSGLWFSIQRNSGMSMLSRHCYTLYIDGEVIFTSGEFWRAYSVIKSR